MLVDYKGKVIQLADEGKEQDFTQVLSMKQLTDFRKKFNVGLDWDEFEIK